jgi:acyl-CoA synthetase (AMP-forming)/AMP-acid ligase II
MTTAVDTEGPGEGADHQRRLNIYPREVEEVLLRHPSVAEVAVVGVPDPVWGQNVVAFVVAGTGPR